MTHRPASSQQRRAGRGIPRTRRALTALAGLAVSLTAAIGLAPAASASLPSPGPPVPPPPPPTSATAPAHLPLWAVVAMVAATVVLAVATTLITLAVERLRRARHTPAVAADPVRRGRPDRPRKRYQQEFNEPSTLFAEAHLKRPGDRAQAKTARPS
jgi:hypothetical protein